MFSTPVKRNKSDLPNLRRRRKHLRKLANHPAKHALLGKLTMLLLAVLPLVQIPREVVGPLDVNVASRGYMGDVVVFGIALAVDHQ